MSDPWADILAGRSRMNGSYAAQKLSFFARFLPPAFNATKKKSTRHYIDLFAGPGIWRDRSGKRHLGSPLEVLSISSQVPYGEGFTEAHLVNMDAADHEALERRIDLAAARGLINLPRDRIHVIRGDANLVISDILGGIHTLSWILTYADIERPGQWPWTTVESLRTQGHKSMDLYALFPLQMAILRMVGFSKILPAAVTRFYGTEDWQSIANERITSAHSRSFRMAMEQLYAERLHSLGWPHVRRQRRIAIKGARILYYMLFAGSHDAAAALSDWEVVADGDERHRGQGDLFEN